MKITNYKNTEIEYNIVVVGTGGTGSQLMPFLTQLMANKTGHRLTVIDGDRFENKNKINQKCIDRDLGRFKSEVIATRYKKIYSDLDINYIDEYIKDKNKLIDLLKYDTSIPILISCVDNNATRKLFHEVFYDENIPELIYIDSGNGTDNMVGQVITGYKKMIDMKQVKDSTGHYNEFALAGVGEVILQPVGDMHSEILDEQDSIDKVLSCANHIDEAPQNIATNILAATTIFTIVNNLISFNKIHSHVSYFDARKPQVISRGLEDDED